MSYEDDPEYDEGPICSACDAPVDVRRGCEWVQGWSVCDPCAQDELEDTVAQLTEAKAVLREVDRVWRGPCHFCRRFDVGPDAHTLDCRLAKFLGGRNGGT